MLQIPDEVKTLKKEGNHAVFELAPLMPGYGATVANPLRRVLLSSLEGAAVTSVRIKGVDHEFTSIPGVQEDVTQVILNVKKIRFLLFSAEPATISLTVKGDKKVYAKDLKLTSDVELINSDQYIATLSDKKSELQMELTVEKGVGYVPVEQRKKEKLPIGVIAVDAVFSPIKLVNFNVEDVRVGQRIDYNKVIIEIETDGSMEPEVALKSAAEILIDQFKVISQIPVEAKKENKVKAKKPKKSAKQEATKTEDAIGEDIKE